jgi:hypothetical protein
MEEKAENVRVVESAEVLWGLPLQPAGCSHCGQVYLVTANKSMLCPNCAKTELTAQPARLRREAPEKIVSFQVQHSGLKTIFSEFVRSVWLRFDDFNEETLLQHAVPVFAPMWLVDSDVSGAWQAEAGFDYQVKSSQDYYGSGGWQTHDVLEKRARWEPRLGQLERHYDNAVTPALSDHARLMARVGELSLERARGYEPSLLGEAVLRVPDLQPDQAWPLAKDALEQRVAQDCQQAAGAQHMRNFSARLTYGAQHWTQMLLPLYFTWYSDDEGRRHVVLVNGQSGAVGGVRLASQRKGWKWAGIIAAGAVVLFLLALLGFALGALFPPAALVGTVLAVLALFVGIGAIVPAVWPWQWNRRLLGIGVKESS